jgi:hypothetical protein
MNVGSSLEILKDIFSLSSLRDHVSEITWDSSLLDDWTPHEVTIPAEPGETPDHFTLRQGDNFVSRAPFRLRKWLSKVLMPHKDPMAFLIFLLKRLQFGFLNIDWIVQEEFFFALFTIVTPRYY